MNGSHVAALLLTLERLGVFDCGVIPANILHDNGCKTLRTSSSLDCFCNCEAVICGQRYSFKEYVQGAERVQ